MPCRYWDGAAVAEDPPGAGVVRYAGKAVPVRAGSVRCGGRTR